MSILLSFFYIHVARSLFCFIQAYPVAYIGLRLWSNILLVLFFKNNIIFSKPTTPAMGGSHLINNYLYAYTIHTGPGF